MLARDLQDRIDAINVISKEKDDIEIQLKCSNESRLSAEMEFALKEANLRNELISVRESFASSEADLQATHSAAINELASRHQLDISKYTSDLDQTKSRLESLEAALAASDSSVVQLQASIASEIQKQVSLQALLDDRSVAVHNLEEELAASMKKAQQDLISANQSIEELRLSATKNKDDIDNLDLSSNNSTAKIAELQVALDASKNAINDLNLAHQNKLEALSAIVSKLKSEVSFLKVINFY